MAPRLGYALWPPKAVQARGWQSGPKGVAPPQLDRGFTLRALGPRPPDNFLKCVVGAWWVGEVF